MTSPCRGARTARDSLLAGRSPGQHSPVASPAPAARRTRCPDGPAERMESLLDARALGEDSLQMWDLNKRLEAYLARVKSLEEENEGLKAELHRLRGSGPPEGSWRGQYDEAVAALRAALGQAFGEKNAAELARAGLQEEVRRVASRCQKERAAREEAQKLLAARRKELEEEKRGQAWLRAAAAQLEQELGALEEAHREERARLEQEAASCSWRPEAVRGPALTFPPLEVDDYSRRLSSLWREAVETYQAEVSRLEASLGEAEENLGKAAESHRQSQLHLQRLGSDLAGLRARKAALEERLAQQGQRQRGEAEKLQLAVEGLEEEKRALTTQIAHVLEGRRQLMRLKMSLSLEVATYRTLLEAESLRLQMPADHKLAFSLQDSKSEGSYSERQAVSLGKGNPGSQDPKLSCTTFSKGGMTPQLPQNQRGSFPVNVASVFPKSRSPVVREFQKANTVLQSQSAKAFEVVDIPAFINSAGFQLGTSQQNEVVTASKEGTISQTLLHESPQLFNTNRPLVPNILEESSKNAEQSHPPGEEGDDISAEMKMKKLGEEAELHEEVEEEEKQPNEEPPWKTTVRIVPCPSQLVTEALEIALQEVHVGEVPSEVSLLNVPETPNGVPSDDSSSMEEGHGAATSPSVAALEDTLELHKSRVEDHHSAGLPGGVKGSEDSSEANGGPEVCSEQQEEEGVWVSQDEEPSSLQETQLLEEERGPSTQRNKEEIVFDIPVPDKIDCCNETNASEQNEGGNKQPPNIQSFMQRGELEKGFKCTESASQLDTGAAAILRGDQNSPELGTSCPEDHTGAMGPDSEETDGGIEDLEVVSTEALHLSEDEEQRALSSPSRESEECDFQAEMLESEFLQTEEFAVETLAPISHSFYSAESLHHFLGVEQETPEEETSLSKTGSALPQEVGEEVDLEPAASSVEEAILRGDEHSTYTMAAEPRAMEEAGAEEQHMWEPQHDILGHEDLLEAEDALGKEVTMEKKEMATLQDWTCDQQTALQQETVESVLRQETSTRDQGENTEEECQGDLPVGQRVEEDDLTTKGQQGEETVETCQDLPVEQKVEEEDLTTKGQQGEETVEPCQGDLPVEQQVEEEDLTTKGEQGEETVEAYQGDLPVEQQMEEEVLTTKGQQGEETVEACQDLPVEQQVEEDLITKGQQGDETVEAYQDLPVDQQVEEDLITKGQQREETVEAFQDLPVDQQVEEEDLTTKGQQGEERVEVCQDLPVEQQVEEEYLTTKGQQGDETVEACQDLPVEQQVEEEDLTTKGQQGEERVEVCQDLPVEQQVEEEDLTTKGQQGEETVEACQDLPVEQQVEEDLTTKGQQREETVEVCQDLPVDQQMEEDLTTKGQQGDETIEECQDLPVDQQMEEEDLTTKGQQGEERVESCLDLPVEQQVEEDLTTKGQQGDETVEVCLDLPVEQQVEEEDLTTKGQQEEERVEVCQDLPVEQQVGEDLTTKGQQGDETVETCQDLPVEQQMEEDLTTKGQQRKETVEECQDLSVDQQMEKEDLTTKGKQDESIEACQDLPVDQQMEEEDLTTKGQQDEERVEACQDLPVEQQVEEDPTTKGQQGDETVEACQDLQMEQQMEEDLTTKGQQREETVEACQDLPVDQQMEEEDLTTKGKQDETIEACQDLPVDQQMEEEDLTSKGQQGDETVEACQDLPVEQQVEEDLTTKGQQGEQTEESCQGDLPMEQKVEEEDLTTKGQQGEVTVEACAGDLPVEQQVVEEEIIMASPVIDTLKREDLITGSEIMETEETEPKTSLVEKGEMMGYVNMGDVEEKENPEAKQLFRTGTPQVEQHVTAESDDTDPNQHSQPCNQGLPHGTSIGASEVPSEVQDNTANGFEAMSYSGPEDMDTSSESEHRLQSDHSGSEVSTESLDVSSKSTCETEGFETELGSSKHIKLEETLPDNTPLHLYDEKMWVVTELGQLLPENEEAAEAPLGTKDGTTSAEAMKQAVGPYRSQTENDEGKVWEAVDEERGGNTESTPQLDSLNSEELPVSKVSEESTAETLELIRDKEEDLPACEAETPSAEELSPPLDAEFDEQPGEILGHGSGLRKECVYGEMTHEETGSTDFVWETERDSVFQTDQPDLSYLLEGFQGENGSPLEFSDPNNIVSEGSHKVSPLTSVADLGEIVLEEEQSPDVQKDGAEADGVVYYEDGSMPSRVHEYQPISGLENCGREEPTQQTGLPERNSGGTGFADLPLKAEASLSIDSLKDSDILEIVEQALEFNQEVIKAAEQTVGAEKWAGQGDVLCSPAEESDGSSSLALPNVGRPQVSPKKPSAPSPMAKDPTGSSHLWVENNSEGLQQDSSPADFTTEILNGIGGLHAGSRVYDAGPSREIAVSQRLHGQDLEDLSPLEMMNQNPPWTLANEEAPRTGEISPAIHEDASLEHSVPERPHVGKSLLANTRHSAHGKGKDGDKEAVSIPPPFGDEILHLESHQHLKFRPEEEEEFWSPADN